VIHDAISRRIHDANIMNRNGLRKSSVKREKRGMSKSKSDWNIILTPSHPASSQSRRSNVNDVRDRILLQDYENSSEEVGKGKRRKEKKKRKEKRKRAEKGKREKGEE